MPLQLTVNGTSVTPDVPAATLLVDLLRDTLRLTGTHVGCDTSQCGCCTVLVDDAPVKSCTMLAVQAEGCRITTIEGLAPADGPLHPVQQAFVDAHGLQCGFCTPGMVLASCALLARHPDPTDAQIVHGLEGNLCRCTGYANIVAAVRRAAAAPAAAGAADR
jgi:carbon-monoxide dehydrogenase small subunit